mgnify:FL=1
MKKVNLLDFLKTQLYNKKVNIYTAPTWYKTDGYKNDPIHIGVITEVEDIDMAYDEGLKLWLKIDTFDETIQVDFDCMEVFIDEQ